MKNKHIEQGYHEAEQREENFLETILMLAVIFLAILMLAVIFLITTLIFISLFMN